MIKIYRKTDTVKAEQFDDSDEMAEKYKIEDDITDVVPYPDGPHEIMGSFIKTTDKSELSEIHRGDWIITGVNGKRWILPNDTFKKTYTELPAISTELDSYIQSYKRNGYGITEMLYDLTDEVCPDVNLTKDDIARAWLDGYQVEGK